MFLFNECVTRPYKPWGEQPKVLYLLSFVTTIWQLLEILHIGSEKSTLQPYEIVGGESCTIINNFNFKFHHFFTALSTVRVETFMLFAMGGTYFHSRFCTGNVCFCNKVSIESPSEKLICFIVFSIVSM